MKSHNSGHNTLFVRLEGPLQSWGDPSKFVIRRTMDAPTKSGVLGLICCAMGLSRQAARERLSELRALEMGVRIDRPGVRWWDYHTVGAGTGLTTAAGNIKTGAQGTLITRREYLADANFLVVLQGDAELIRSVADALAAPKWPIYLGRRSCPPSAPVFCQPHEGETWVNPMHIDGGLGEAISRVPWRPRSSREEPSSHGKFPCLIEWQATAKEPGAPDDAELWYDVPTSFEPPAHRPRFVVRTQVDCPVGEAMQRKTPPPPRPRANYTNAAYRKVREERLKSDHGLCVFCKAPATTVQHITYRDAGGNESLNQLRSLCRLCHDAVTMLEYGAGMGLDRINPEDASWRNHIVAKRAEIVAHRSLETRRRRLRSEEVE